MRRWLTKKWIVLFVVLIAISIGYWKFFGESTPQRHKVRVAACLIVSDGDRTVLGLRKKENRYGLIGGHLEAGETVHQAMVREAKEEAGIDIDPKDLEIVHVLRYNHPVYDYVFFFFKATTWQGTIRNMEPEKCAGWEWFDKAALPKDMMNWAMCGLKGAQEELLFSEYLDLRDVKR